MKVAHCDMDESNIVGHRLLALRGVKQLGKDFSKQRVAEKKATEDWKALQKMTHHRSRNMTQFQCANLKTKAAAATAKTPRTKKRKPADIVTPSPTKRSRLRRRDQALPVRSKKTQVKINIRVALATVPLSRDSGTVAKATSIKLLHEPQCGFVCSPMD